LGRIPEKKSLRDNNFDTWEEYWGDHNDIWREYPRRTYLWYIKK